MQVDILFLRSIKQIKVFESKYDFYSVDYKMKFRFHSINLSGECIAIFLFCFSYSCTRYWPKFYKQDNVVREGTTLAVRQHKPLCQFCPLTLLMLFGQNSGTRIKMSIEMDIAHICLKVLKLKVTSWSCPNMALHFLERCQPRLQVFCPCLKLYMYVRDGTSAKNMFHF